MRPLELPAAPAPLRLLCLGAHADDIEIGCGGTVLRLLATRPGVHVTWVVFSAPGRRQEEAQRGASRFLEGAAGRDVIVATFRDGYFPWQGAEIKDFFEGLKQRGEFDIVFTHFRDDHHQDHRTISDLTWNTWRNHLVMEYEIPKYDGDMGRPNCFVPVDEHSCMQKARFIRETFASEAGKAWMNEDTFLALMRLRGVECASPTRHAEAFHCRKFVLGAA